MSLYRKIHMELFADEKYRSLSPPQPCAQFLWIYLLAGPHTTSIPGLSSTGEMALAEMIGWSLKDFRKTFGEISSLGMVKADWKNRVVWIPKAIVYNPPESPNVVKSWGKQWGMIPQCPLKTEAREAIVRFLAASNLGTTFRKAFREAFKEDLPEGPTKVAQPTFVNPSGNQEQEQEQEHTPPDGGGVSVDGREIEIQQAQQLSDYRRFASGWLSANHPNWLRKTGSLIDMLQALGKERGIEEAEIAIAEANGNTNIRDPFAYALSAALKRANGSSSAKRSSPPAKLDSANSRKVRI